MRGSVGYSEELVPTAWISSGLRSRERVGLMIGALSTAVGRAQVSARAEVEAT
jgi:hypothetical protein